MASEEKPKKPLPSVAEINAYLEKSAARTRKRLPLAMGQPKPAPLAALPTASSKLKLKIDKPKISTEAAPDKTSSEAAPGWKPFSVAAAEKKDP